MSILRPTHCRYWLVLLLMPFSAGAATASHQRTVTTDARSVQIHEFRTRTSTTGAWTATCTDQTSGRDEGKYTNCTICQVSSMNLPSSCDKSPQIRAERMRRRYFQFHPELDVVAVSIGLLQSGGCRQSDAGAIGPVRVQAGTFTSEFDADASKEMLARWSGAKGSRDFGADAAIPSVGDDQALVPSQTMRDALGAMRTERALSITCADGRRIPAISLDGFRECLAFVERLLGVQLRRAGDLWSAS